jgi:hypothetical protein
LARLVAKQRDTFGGYIGEVGGKAKRHTSSFLASFGCREH